MNKELIYDKKSYILGFLLVFVFGSIGLLYSNIVAGFIMMILTFLISPILLMVSTDMGLIPATLSLEATFVIAIMIHLISMIIYPFLISYNNKKQMNIAIKLETERQEMLYTIIQSKGV